MHFIQSGKLFIVQWKAFSSRIQVTVRRRHARKNEPHAQVHIYALAMKQDGYKDSECIHSFSSHRWLGKEKKRRLVETALERRRRSRRRRRRLKKTTKEAALPQSERRRAACMIMRLYVHTIDRSMHPLGFENNRRASFLHLLMQAQT